MARRAAAQLTLSVARTAPSAFAGAEAPAARACGAAVARAYATDAVVTAHPPQQSMRTGFAETDPPHTAKWLSNPNAKSPMEWIAEAPPMEVVPFPHTNVTKCYGGVDAAVGHPVEYIVLNDTSAQFPATCKYCGLRYFAGHHHH